jgi:hypothetical protein
MSAQYLGTAQLLMDAFSWNFIVLGSGGVNKIFQENSSLTLKRAPYMKMYMHYDILFTNITMVASVAKVNRVCVAAMVTVSVIFWL